MKIGIICEGKYSDAPALELFLTSEFSHVTFAFAPTDKGLIFDGCGALVDELLAAGCNHVFVLWDLSPVGIQLDVLSQDDEEDPCRLDQRRTLLSRIANEDCECSDHARKLQCRYGFTESNEDADEARLDLVCFSDSFDAVLLADPVLLQEIASSDVRAAEPAPRFKDLESVKRPESQLRRYFAKGHNKWFKSYNKLQHNIALAKEFVKRRAWHKLRLHAAYKRLAEKIESLAPHPPPRLPSVKVGSPKAKKRGKRR